MRFTVKQLSLLEECSVRQVQRYIAQGLRGRKLPAVRVGHALEVERKAYEQWRRECGLDLPAVQPQVSPSPGEADTPETDVHTQSVQIPEPATPDVPRTPEPFYGPAVVNGPLTNVPTAQSGNFAHPDVIRQQTEQNARDLVAQFRGNPDETEKKLNV